VTRKVIVTGTGLHTGVPVRVVLQAREGSVRFSSRGIEVALDELRVASTARATTVEARGLRVGTVEHVLAALGGLGVYDGVSIEIDGPEMPLLDGGAAAWCDAVRDLQVPCGRPRLRVTRHAVIEVGRSRYELSPSPAVEVDVRLEIDDPRISPDARWRGDAEDFHVRIAPARTFAFAHEVDDLLRQGLACHVNPASVVLIAPHAIHHTGRPFSPDEPARHKLLDLVGDIYLRGGPPLGRVSAVRPGHSSNARAFDQACAEGVLVSA